MSSGGIREGAGRPEGSKNEKTIEWENLGEFLTKPGAERLLKIIQDSDDDTFAHYYFMLLEYFKPKQQRREIESSGSITLNWNEEKTYEDKEQSNE